MAFSLPMLVAIATAAPRVTSTFELPEITVGLNAVARSNFRATAGANIQVNLHRSRWFDLELGVRGVLPALHLLQGGLGREFLVVDGFADALWTPSPFLSLGPSVGVSIRHFMQGGWSVATAAMPQVGGRFRLHLLTAKRWRTGLQIRLLADVFPTRLVFGNATIQELPRLTVLSGLYFSYGRDRS